MQELFALVSKWAKGKGYGFIMDSGYYAGRGPTQSDLNSTLLEAFYDGIKKDIGGKEAKNFVRFVNKLNDLSASAFIVAFERFVANDCKTVNIVQNKDDGIRVTGRGGARDAQAFAIIANAFGSPKMTESELRRAHVNVEYEFICKHQKEIPTKERQETASSAYSF